MPTVTLNYLLNRGAEALNTYPDFITKDTGVRATEYRYLIFELMEKAGYKQTEIAEFFEIGREAVNKALSKLDVWKKSYKDIREHSVRLQNVIIDRL